MSVIKNKRTKMKVSNSMQTLGAPLTEDTESSRLLPTVKDSDSGSFLAVDENGAWAKTSAPAGTFRVTTTGNPYSPTGISANLSVILGALNGGKMPYIINTTMGTVYYLKSFTSGAGGQSMVFSNIDISGAVVAINTVQISVTSGGEQVVFGRTVYDPSA